MTLLFYGKGIGRYICSVFHGIRFKFNKDRGLGGVPSLFLLCITESIFLRTETVRDNFHKGLFIM